MNRTTRAPILRFCTHANLFNYFGVVTCIKNNLEMRVSVKPVPKPAPKSALKLAPKPSPKSFVAPPADVHEEIVDLPVTQFGDADPELEIDPGDLDADYANFEMPTAKKKNVIANGTTSATVAKPAVATTKLAAKPTIKPAAKLASAKPVAAASISKPNPVSTEPRIKPIVTLKSIAARKPAAESSAEDVIDAMPASVARSRGPGRPPKNKTMQRTKIQGIIDTPPNPDDFVYMSYHDPATFKRFISMLKSYNVAEFKIDFGPEGMSIKVNDNLGKNNIHFDAYGRGMVGYYCKEPISIWVNLTKVANVLNTITTQHSMITFVSKHEYRSRIYCILTRPGWNEQYEIEVIAPKVEALIGNDNDSDYPLRFHMEAAWLKSMVASTKKITDTFTIQKVEKSPLTIKINGGVGLKGTKRCTDPSIIGMISTLEENDILSVNVNTGHMKHFTDNPISDNVVFAVDQLRKMSLTMECISEKDKLPAISVKVYLPLDGFGATH